METTIRNLIKEAMKERNKNKQVTYKNILEKAQKIAKETNVAVTDEMIVTATRKEIKDLNDLLAYCEAGTDRHNEVTEKIGYCEAVLPKMATEDEIMEYLVTNDADKNMGTCMKMLKEHFGANMDGKMASGVAKRYVNE